MGNAAPGQVACGGREKDDLPAPCCGLPDGLHDGDDQVVTAASVARWFLRAKHRGSREAVESLLQASVYMHGGEACFYSVPQGRGRRVKICREQAPDGFLLVATSNVLRSQQGEKASPQRARVLAQALAEGEADLGRIVAAKVVSSHGVEGVLLVDCCGEAAGTRCPSSELLTAVGLWAAMLGERLEKMEGAAYTEALRVALENVQSTLGQVLRTPCGKKAAESMVPESLLRGMVKSDRVSLWAYDAGSKELVLNNNGHANGTRAPVDKFGIGESVNGSEGAVLCIRDVYNDKRFEHSTISAGLRNSSPTRMPTICVPLWSPSPCNVGGDKVGGDKVSTKGGSWSVVQFTSTKHDGEELLDHFDLAKAEALQRSALPSLLQIRECILRLIAQDRQRESLQALVDKLSTADTVMDIAKLAEREVVNVMDCEQCTLFFIDEVQDEIWSPPTEALPNGICIGVGEGMAGHVVLTARSSASRETFVLTVNDPPSCPYWKGDVKAGFVTRNIMTTPVWSGGKNRRLLGLIQVLNRRQSIAATGLHGGGGGGGGKDSDGLGFSLADEKLLQLLAQGVGDHLQRLMMDMMFTKARMDVSSQGRESGAAAIDDALRSEYYIGNQAANGTVVRGTECVAMALNVDPALRARLALPQSPSSPSSPFSPKSPSSTSLPEISDIAQGQCSTDTWSLDYWSLSLEEGFSLLVKALTRSGVLPELDVEMGSLYNYFKVVKCSYRNNPYHRFAHAVMVVHYSYRYMTSMNVTHNLAKSDIMALIIGALVHDIDHRGRNNAFESMTRSELAIRYNDSSPLENHHCAQAFQIALSRGECNIFKNLEAQTFGALRQRMIAGILSTDMKFHGDHVKLLQSFELQPSAESSQAQFLVEVVLHAADISGPCMPREISMRWVKAIHTEFTLQVEDEKRLGLPVTKFMDGMKDPVYAAKSQVGFLDFVMHPLYDPLWAAFPGLAEVHASFDENKRLIVDVAEGRGGSPPIVDVSAE